MLTPILAQLPETINDWKHFTDAAKTQGLRFGINLLAAIAIFVFGRWMALFLSGILRKVFAKSRLEPTVATFLADLIYALLLTFVIVSALGQLGFDTTSFAAVIAAAGLAVGLALQGSLSNFASGVLLILFKPFKVGDSVDVAGAGGTVEEIRVFSTLFRTGDNVQVTVPNSQITQGVIKNYSASGTRRIELLISCSYADDLKRVKAFLEALVRKETRVLNEPAPSVAVNELTDNGVQIAVRPWVKTADYGDVRADLAEAIKAGFDDNRFTIATSRKDSHVRTTNP
jgi:small conductance mechanosensitive channel